MRIAIIGGGIGGLSAALQLLKPGFDVHVYEQAAAIGEIGAGIQISPNASRLLLRLGLKAAMDRVGVQPRAVHQRRWDDGRTLQRSPLGPEIEANFGAPYYHFHRADLANLLAGALPRERLHAGHKLRGLEQKGERVTARFDNGATAEVDLLVGADGSRSSVRSVLGIPMRGPDHLEEFVSTLFRAPLRAHLDAVHGLNMIPGPRGLTVMLPTSNDSVMTQICFSPIVSISTLVSR